MRDDARYCLNCGAGLGEADGAASGPGADPTRRVEPVAAEPPPQDLIECPRCEAPNSPNRARCGRCGGDLTTGEPRPGRSVPRPRPTAGGGPDGPDTGPLRVERRRSRRPLTWVVAVGVALGALIGGAAVAEIGPFAPDESTPEAVFDPGVYRGQPRPLTVDRVLASSTHEPQGDNRYDAVLVSDGNLATAWNSDGSVRANGVGETLRLDLAEPAWISGIVIANGYQKDDRSFVANGRVQRLRLSFGGAEVYDVSVLDRSGRQVVNLAEPVLATSVTISVLESYAGETYADLAISEIEVRGWTAVGQDLDRFTEPEPGESPSEAASR